MNITFWVSVELFLKIHIENNRLLKCFVQAFVNLKCRDIIIRNNTLDLIYSIYIRILHLHYLKRTVLVGLRAKRI